MSREGDWLCSSCSHLNFKWRVTCQKCYSLARLADSLGINRKTQGEVALAGDWYCNVINCGAHNYASRASCYKCGSSKDYDYFGHEGSNGSGLPGWKSGDWICTRFGCGAHNYASKMECFKCRTPRDFGGAV